MQILGSKILCAHINAKMNLTKTWRVCTNFQLRCALQNNLIINVKTMNTNCRHKFQQNYIASSTQSNVSWNRSEGKELPSTCIILVQGYIIKMPKCPIYGPSKKKVDYDGRISFINKKQNFIDYNVDYYFFVISYKSFKHIVCNVC